MVRKTVFSNGLTLVSERCTEFQSLSLGIWVKTGTRFERPHEAGISHFIEHMVFKGTTRRSALEIAREIDQVGGDFNAFTTRENTCFHMMLLARDIDLAANILTDVILNSEFNADELERERKVILQEISMVEDTPEELLHDLYFEQIYGRHGLGKPILGTENSVRKLRRADILRYFRKHYRPEQTIISVAGNVAHSVLKRKFRALSRGQWTGRSPQAKSKSKHGHTPAPRLRTGNWWVVRPTEQVHLVWGVGGPHLISFKSEKDRYALHLLNTFLGAGMSSLLFQEIREKEGLAYTVYSTPSLFKDSGVFTIYAATAPHQVAQCLRIIDQCVQQVCQKSLTEDELENAKENIKGNLLLSNDSVESRMMGIAQSEMFLGKDITIEEICERIDEVKLADIRRIARKVLQVNHKSIMALGPKPSRALRKKLGFEVLKK